MILITCITDILIWQRHCVTFPRMWSFRLPTWNTVQFQVILIVHKGDRNSCSGKPTDKLCNPVTLKPMYHVPLKPGGQQLAKQCIHAIWLLQNVNKTNIHEVNNIIVS